MNKITGVLFDLDGTLVDSIGGIANAINKVLETKGYPTHQTEAYLSMVGYGLDKSIQRSLPETVRQSSDLKVLVDAVEAVYAKEFLVDTKLYDGIPEILSLLDQHDIPWAVHTNKLELISVKIVKALMSNWKCQGVYGPSEINTFKPDPSGAYKLIKEMGLTVDKDKLKESVLFVGDTEVDFHTANNIPSKSVLVSWGFRKYEDLKVLESDYLFETQEALLEFLKENLRG